MDDTVPSHDATAAHSHPKAQTGVGWSDFFQSLDRRGPHRASPVSSKPVGRFATSA